MTRPEIVNTPALTALPKVGDYVMKGREWPSLVRVIEVDEARGWVVHVAYVQIRYDGDIIGGGACLGGMLLAEFSAVTEPEYLLAADVHRARVAEAEARAALTRAEETIRVNTAAVRAIVAARELAKAAVAPPAPPPPPPAPAVPEAPPSPTPVKEAAPKKAKRAGPDAPPAAIEPKHRAGCDCDACIPF